MSEKLTTCGDLLIPCLLLKYDDKNQWQVKISPRPVDLFKYDHEQLYILVKIAPHPVFSPHPVHLEVILLTLCMLGNLSLFFFCCLPTFFSKLFFSKKKSLRNTIRVSNSFDPHRTDFLSIMIWVQTVCKGY